MKRYLKTLEQVIDALRAGKVIHDEDSQWALHKGFIVRKDNGFDDWVVNDSIDSSYSNVYIEESEPLKLEVGKFYKTRGGKKVIILANNCEKPNNPYLVAGIDIWGKPYKVNKNGRVYENDETNPWNIIAPWQD